MQFPGNPWVCSYSYFGRNPMILDLWIDKKSRFKGNIYTVYV